MSLRPGALLAQHTPFALARAASLIGSRISSSTCMCLSLPLVKAHTVASALRCWILRAGVGSECYVVSVGACGACECGACSRSRSRRSGVHVCSCVRGGAIRFVLPRYAEICRDLQRCAPTGVITTQDALTQPELDYVAAFYRAAPGMMDMLDSSPQVIASPL